MTEEKYVYLSPSICLFGTYFSVLNHLLHFCTIPISSNILLYNSTNSGGLPPASKILAKILMVTRYLSLQAISSKIPPIFLQPRNFWMWRKWFLQNSSNIVYSCSRSIPWIALQESRVYVTKYHMCRDGILFAPPASHTYIAPQKSPVSGDTRDFSLIKRIKWKNGGQKENMEWEENDKPEKAGENVIYWSAQENSVYWQYIKSTWAHNSKHKKAPRIPGELRAIC